MSTGLQHTEELCRIFFEETSDGIFISDAQGYFLEVNLQGCVLLGYSQEEISQLSWPDLLSNEKVAQKLLAWEEGNEDQPAWIEAQVWSKEGRLLTVEIRLRRLIEGHLVAFVRDIGLYKRAVEIQIGHELLVNQSRDIVLIIRQDDGLILEANEATTKAYGYSREELLALSIHDLRAPDTQSHTKAQMAEANTKGILFETIHQRKDGSVFPVEVSSQGTLIKGIPTLISVIRDITERKRAEEALRRSEHKFATAFRISPDAININRLSDGRYLDINEGFTQITGYSREEALGQSSLELMIWANPADRARLVQGLRERGQVENLEAEFRMKDGTLRTGLMSARLIELEGEACILSITRDITQRKRAEEALYLTRFSLERVADAIYWLDEEARIIDVNETACRMLGYSREELLRFSVIDIDPDFSPEIWRERRRRLQHLGAQIFERTHRTKDGRLIPVELVANFIEFGERTLNCSFARDISERKQAAEAQAKLEEQLRQAQKMESIGRLAGGIAHDFNNLLTVILGYSELMQIRLPHEDRTREQLEQIRQAAQRAEALTRQLLAFSRKQMLIPVVLDLNELVTNLRKMLERVIGEDVTLITLLQPDLWPVKADPGQVEQVLMNLVVNARDAMPTGGRLTIETANVQFEDSFRSDEAQTLRGPSVRLTITDTGQGMDETTLARIFEPFFTTKEQGKGTGLGLATVYGIIKQSGGEISVDSQPGHGAVFSLYLPALETILPDLAAPLPELAVQPGRETILMVEDELGVRDLIRLALRNYGYTLLEADHGYQALALAQQQTEPIDLLLTDVVMPQMDGRELAERLKALHPHIKVLFISGYTNDEIIRHGVQMAEVEFLSKPFSPVALAIKVREILDR